MLGFKYFICSLILWLSLSSPQDFIRDYSSHYCQRQIITTTNDNDHQAYIIKGNHITYQANWSFKAYKTLNTTNNHNEIQPKAETYDYKLLYLDISKNITLKFTSRKLIFPFHCFT